MTLARAQFGFGQVHHKRLKPVVHAFRYGSFFWLLPMRALARSPEPLLRRNGRAWLSFHDADHGVGGPDALAWLDGVLRQHGCWEADLPQGEVWLQTYPRVLGYVFKPVSFWYVHRPDGGLHAVVAEVNNTFGERHCYLLDAPVHGQVVRADKVFHVSPFCEVRGEYRFIFMRTDTGGRARTVARIDYHDDPAAPPLLQTSVSGTLMPLDAATTRRALLGHPVLTLGVIARIHWQALRLWLQRTPFFRQPPAPDHFVTQGRPALAHPNSAETAVHPSRP